MKPEQLFMPLNPYWGFSINSGIVLDRLAFTIRDDHVNLRNGMENYLLYSGTTKAKRDYLFGKYFRMKKEIFFGISTWITINGNSQWE